ncbi:MAG: hypothetical protein JSR59_16660 [Proteobacteria bacterium]|nr:hypothetical protein [Pseudomonadota bacterium]
MTLDQFHALKVWHGLHGQRRPFEKGVWTTIVTLWLMGWMGVPISWVLHRPWAAASSVALTFLPGAYVTLRRWLHRARRLRCDWLVALRR